MDNPKFSVITCVYNREKFLQKCLDSVKGQTFKDFEHIIVYGYSTDKTKDIIDKYVKDNPDMRIKVVEAEVKGISNAMNLGIENSTGEIISFVHSDDYYISDKVLWNVNNIFESNKGKDWMFGNQTREIRNKRIILRSNLILKNLKSYPFKIPSMVSHDNSFVKRTVFDKYGLFDEKYKIIMDYEFLTRLARTDKPLVVDESFVVCVMHRDSASMSLRNKHKIIFELAEVLLNIAVKTTKSNS